MGGVCGKGPHSAGGPGVGVGRDPAGAGVGGDGGAERPAGLASVEARQAAAEESGSASAGSASGPGAPSEALGRSEESVSSDVAASEAVKGPPGAPDAPLAGIEGEGGYSPSPGHEEAEVPAESRGPAGFAVGAVPGVEKSGVEADAAQIRLAGKGKKQRGRRLVAGSSGKRLKVSPEQRLLLLDTWQRSGLPAGDFADLAGISKHALYTWKKRFNEEGPEGLVDKPKGCPKGSRLPEITKRAILMLKEAHPEYGCQRISDMLARGPALPASASAVARALHETGYELEEQITRPHAPQIRRFERARPNQLWQTDLFTFILKRQNRRGYLIAFMDDHSRFITSYGVHGGASTALVLEVFRAGISSFQAPEEVLTDNGPQYVTWRGKSAFAKECEKLGIRQIVARPRRPQTLGKVERFWGTLWRDFLQTAVFLDLEDARRRIGLFLDYYNFQRPHQGIDGLTPADRFFGAAPEVLRTMKERLRENALELARRGVPKEPFYLAGQLDGRPFSLHAEGERVYLLQEGGERQEVELITPHALISPEDPDRAEGALAEGLGAVARSMRPQEASPSQGPQGSHPSHPSQGSDMAEEGRG